MPDWGAPLKCPDCEGIVAWNGEQFVCGACPWTEHRERPPSDRSIQVPDPKSDEA
jgi:hypothetical protein